MNEGKPVPTAASLLDEIDPESPFTTKISRAAPEKLAKAFEGGCRLAILDSGWSAGSDDLIASHVEAAGESTFVARIPSSCRKEIDGLRFLVQPVGVNTAKLGFADLENVFSRFIAFQEKRKRRSIIVIEETSGNRRWVYKRIQQILDLDKNGTSGMSIILKRCASYAELAGEPALPEKLLEKGKRLSLVPFRQADTRQFVRWRIDAAATAEIDRIFDFQAITLIHELAEGVPDVIDALCCEALEMADNEDIAPVTTEIVTRTREKLGLEVPKNAETNAFDAIPTLPVPSLPRILVSYKGKKQGEIEIEKDRISIGRATENDICIESPFVSRKHAAIIRDGVSLAVVDLDSQNGTYVNSRKVRAQTMNHQDEIKIGYHTIRYLDPDSPTRVSLGGVRSARSPRPRYMARSAGAAGTAANALRTTLHEPDSP